MLFSERKGTKKPKVVIQLNDMDNDLKIRLWNLLDIFYWEKKQLHTMDVSIDSSGICMLVFHLWHRFFKQPIDTIGNYWPDVLNKIRTTFFGYQWDRIYDFIEFVSKYHQSESINESFRAACNSVLAEEVSGYRFVGKEISDITTNEEIEELEQALQSPLAPAREHLARALELYSDKKKPDFRNSIKESISAVEAICKAIVKNEKASLSDALKKMEEGNKIHPALKDAFIKMYGYTSDADGIRHSLMDETKLNSEDARYFLIASSAFINYLVIKKEKN